MQNPWHNKVYRGCNELKSELLTYLCIGIFKSDYSGTGEAPTKSLPRSFEKSTDWCKCRGRPAGRAELGQVEATMQLASPEEEEEEEEDRARAHRQQKSNHRCDSHDVPRESAAAAATLLKPGLEREGARGEILCCSMGNSKSALAGPMSEERSPGAHVGIRTTPN